MSPTIWTDSFRIRANEVDMHGLVRLDALFGYFQEAAGHHARLLGVGRQALEAQGCFWVLSRCWMQIRKYPAWGQDVIVRTWPRGVERLFALRHFRLQTEDGLEFGSGISAWLILDQAKHRPVRPAPFLQHIIVPNEPKVNGDLVAKQVTASDAGELRRISVPYSDLDVNRHVNNAAYERWILDSFGPELQNKQRIDSIRIDYLSETLFDETIALKAQGRESNGSQLVLGARATTDQPVFQAGITWRKGHAGAKNNAPRTDADIH